MLEPDARWTSPNKEYQTPKRCLTTGETESSTPINGGIPIVDDILYSSETHSSSEVNNRQDHSPIKLNIARPCVAGTQTLGHQLNQEKLLTQIEVSHDSSGIGSILSDHTQDNNLSTTSLDVGKTSSFTSNLTRLQEDNDGDDSVVRDDSPCMFAKEFNGTEQTSFFNAIQQMNSNNPLSSAASSRYQPTIESAGVVDTNYDQQILAASEMFNRSVVNRGSNFNDLNEIDASLRRLNEDFQLERALNRTAIPSLPPVSQQTNRLSQMFKSNQGCYSQKPTSMHPNNNDLSFTPQPPPPAPNPWSGKPSSADTLQKNYLAEFAWALDSLLRSATNLFKRGGELATTSGGLATVGPSQGQSRTEGSCDPQQVAAGLARLANESACSESTTANVLASLARLAATSQHHQSQPSRLDQVSSSNNDGWPGADLLQLLKLTSASQATPLTRQETLMNPPQSIPTTHGARFDSTFDVSSCQRSLLSRPIGSGSRFTSDLAEEIDKLTTPYQKLLTSVEDDIERAANVYRNSASAQAQRNEATETWTGELPPRSCLSMTFSRKVFLGGVPWDCASDDLIGIFSRYGNMAVLWPQRETNASGNFNTRTQTPKGYCYLVFEHESSVVDLLGNCTHDPSNGGDYYRISSQKFKAKDVQVIPWVISDSQYSKVTGNRSDTKMTVFIGALHGMITAEALARIMDELFGNVDFAALDTDKYKYPIGSGRVTFSCKSSFFNAVNANFVEIRTSKFIKTIQIDPYLEDAMCSICFHGPGVYFCRSLDCFRYFCPTCWHHRHSVNEAVCSHKPLRRTFKPIGERSWTFSLRHSFAR